MLKCNRLRLDPGNGSPVVDYRIENGCVESRTLAQAEDGNISAGPSVQPGALSRIMLLSFPEPAMRRP